MQAQISPPFPLKEKNYFAHKFDELDECSAIIPSTQTTQALGKLLIFYWWTWLSKHNKNRLSVIAPWKSRWQSSRAASGSLKFQMKSICSLPGASGKISPPMKKTGEVSPLFLGCWVVHCFLSGQVVWGPQGRGDASDRSSEVQSQGPENHSSPYWIARISSTQSMWSEASGPTMVRLQLRVHCSWFGLARKCLHQCVRVRVSGTVTQLEQRS